MKSFFRKFGLEVKKLPRLSSAEPVLCDDPMEVLHRMRDGEHALLNCPVELLVRPNGWKFGPTSYNPFSESAREIISCPDVSYRGSALERYYNAFRPTTAREAVLGLDAPLRPLEGLAAVLHYLAPWSNKTPEAILEELKGAYQGDLSEHGGPLSLEFDKHGWKDHGPVDELFGEFEHQRIKRVTHSIAQRGLCLKLGVPRTYALRRGNEFRFLIRGGIHRASALDALGYRQIPVGIAQPWCVDMADSDHWPAVRAKIWSKADAEVYFNHLFDFDSGTFLRAMVST